MLLLCAFVGVPCGWEFPDRTGCFLPGVIITVVLFILWVPQIYFSLSDSAGFIILVVIVVVWVFADAGKISVAIDVIAVVAVADDETIEGS